MAFVHCEAGCDRTGEVVGAYRLQYTYKDTRKMYHANCEECYTRCSNYYSSTAQEWFCYYLLYKYFTLLMVDETRLLIFRLIRRYGMDTGDCTDFAECKPFGDCQEKHPM